MGKKFARKFATLLLSLAMVFSCLFILSACKDKSDPADEVTVTSISVALDEESAYTLEENVIEVFYNSGKFVFSSSDFVVTANKSDNTTAVLSQKSDTVDGYTLTSTVPTTDVTSVGEYKLTFSYTGVSDVEIQVKVKKGNIDVSGVTLKNLTYNGSAQTLQIADILNLPENVSAEFVSGNSGTNADDYEAVVKFTYTGDDADSYNEIPNRTISWKINKATYSVSNIRWVRGTTTLYTGLPQTVEIEGELPAGVTIKEYKNNVYTNVGHYTASVSFNYDEVNYNEPVVDSFAWDIEKAPLNVKAKNATITFGEPATHNGVVYTGFVNGETESVLGGELLFGYGMYRAGANVSTYPIAPTGLASNNYAISYTNGSLVVNKATYSYDEINWVYTAPYTYASAVQKPTVTGVPTYVNYEIVSRLSGNIDESINAGSYTATFTVSDFTNYDFTGEVPTQDYVIGKAELSVTARNHTITYTDAPANDGVVCSGFKGSDNLSIFAGQEFVYDYDYAQNDDAGKYTITVSGVTSNNYNITFNTGELTVQAITLQYSTIIFDYSEPFEYDGQEKGLTVSGNPTYVTYSIAYTKGGETATPKNAGTYVATFVVTESNNYTYTGTVASQEFRIDKVALTVTANDKEITFGDDPSNANVSYNGFVNGENESVLGGELAFSYTYEKGYDVGEYDIEISGLTAENYEISYVSGTLTVSPMQVNVSSYAWDYSTLTYTGLKQEPKLASVPSFIQTTYSYTQSSVEANPTNVGSYVASVTLSASSNYQLLGTVANLDFEIEKADLIVTAKNYSIYYRDEAENDGVTYNGFVNEETASVLGGELAFDYGTYVVGSNIGDYPITPSGLTASNYEIQFVAGTLNVEKLTIKLVEFDWDYENAYTYSGVSQKPTLSTYPEFLVLQNYTYTKDSVEDDSIIVGEYLATANFEESDNYEIDGIVSLEYVIEKAELVVTANAKTITYLDEPENDGVEYSGFVNGETESVLGGELSYSYTYEQGDDASEYEILVTGLTADNYEISYEAGTLTVQAITLQYSDYSFNYDGSEEFVYNGTPVMFDVQEVPGYVTYSVVYKLNDETVVAEAVNAGSYTVTFVPDDSANYVFAGEVLKQSFEIEKATIIDSSFGFVIDESNDGISLREREEGQAANLVAYQSSFYYDGLDHIVDFVNTTGIDGVTFAFSCSEESRTINTISNYSFSVEIFITDEVLANYNAPTYTQYFIEIIILDFIQGVNITYIPNTTDSVNSEIQPVSVGFYSSSVTTVDGLIIGAEVIYVDETLNEIYSSVIYTDSTCTNTLAGNITNLNVYDNKLYVVSSTAKNSNFDSRELKIVLTFKADTDEDSAVNANEIQYATNDYAIKSINVETDTILYYNNSSVSGVVTTHCELGKMQYTEYPDEDGDGVPEYIGTPSFSSEECILNSGVNALLIKYVFEYNETIYSYTRDVNIVYSLNGYSHFSVSYNDETNLNSDNSLEISDVSLGDILGENVGQTEPDDSIREICEDVTVSELENGNYEEVTESDGSSSRTVEVNNGNAYLVLSVKEKEDNGSVVTPGQTVTPVSLGVFTEVADSGSSTANIIKVYILLKFNFEIDLNTNATINVSSGTVENYGEYGLIQTTAHNCLNVNTENTSAMIMFARIANSMEELDAFEGFNPADFDVYYGYLSQVLSETGVYSMVIMPTAAPFGIEYEPKIYMINVEPSTDVGGGDVGGGEIPENPNIEFSIRAEDYLGQGVDNSGNLSNEAFSDIFVQDGDIVTLTNWDNTKYIEISTNGWNDYFVVELNENVILEKYSSNFVMNFEEEGEYKIIIYRNLSSGEVSRTIIFNVSGFEKNFLNITSNENNISVDVSKTKDLISDDAIIYSDMLAEDEDEYVEIYLGSVEGLQAGDTYNLEFTSVYAGYLYEVNTATAINYSNGMISLIVKNDNGKLYIEFEIKNLLNQDSDYITPETVVKVYFCDKADRLNYHTVTIGQSSFEVALDLTRAGDYGDLTKDYENGGAYVVVQESDVTGEKVYAKFTAYEDYSRPTGSYEYLMFTVDAYYALMAQIGDGTISTRTEFDTFIDSAMSENQVFDPENQTEVYVPLYFENGLAELYVASVNLTQKLLDKAFPYIEDLIQPIEIRVDGVYTKPEQGGSDNPGGNPGGGVVINPQYYFKDQLPEGIEISVTVKDVVYSTETGDIFFDQNYIGYYVRLNHTYAELVSAGIVVVNEQEGTATATVDGISSTVTGFVIKNMHEQVLDATGSFVTDVQPHVQFGNAIMFVGGLENNWATFILAFNDSIPLDYNENYSSENPGINISVSFNYGESGSKTYSTTTNKFYFQAGYDATVYTRIDLTELDLYSSIRYETVTTDTGNLTKGWLDFTAINIDVSTWLPGAGFIGYVDGWAREIYRDLKAAAFLNTNHFGLAIILEARYDCGDYERSLRIYFILKDSISQPCDEQGQNPGGGNSGSESEGDMGVIDFYYNNFVGELSVFTDGQGNITGDFVVDSQNTDMANKKVTLVKDLDASILTGTGETFLLDGIEYNPEIFEYFEVFDGNNLTTPISVQSVEYEGESYLGSENITLTVVNNSVTVKIVFYTDETKQTPDGEYYFVINFVQSQNS